MQSASSRIWTFVAESISYDDNYYTTGTKWVDTFSNRITPKVNAIVRLEFEIA